MYQYRKFDDVAHAFIVSILGGACDEGANDLGVTLGMLLDETAPESSEISAL
jgi:hypothetical protein